jgi:tetratricopeptide (TPR) repeat protein
MRTASGSAKRKISMSRTVLAAAAILALSVAQIPSTANYRALVAAYRESPDAAIDRILAIPERDLGAAIEAAARPQSNGGWPAADLVAAAMLHTDAAVHLIEHPPGPAVDHLNRAETLADAASDRSPEYEWFEREWTSIAVTLLNQTGSVTRASEVARRVAARRSPGWDVFVRALDAEDRAVRAQLYTPGPRADGNMAKEGFGGAKKLFEEALRRSPQLLDAAVHLGRMEMVDDREDRASAAFVKAAASTRRSTAYLAKLFAGAMAERRNAFGDAEAHYRRALVVAPGSQAARLALAQVLVRTGRSLEARQVVDEQLQRAAAIPIIDPWWVYWRHGKAGVAALRAEIVK